MVNLRSTVTSTTVAKHSWSDQYNQCNQMTTKQLITVKEYRMQNYNPLRHPKDYDLNVLLHLKFNVN